MLKNLRDIRGYVLQATDGEIGRCKDLLFDDQRWVVRHMVVDTSTWPSRQQVLISPPALRGIDWRRKNVTVAATRVQIAESPTVDSDVPVSRQYEQAWFNHFDLPYHWIGPERWGFSPTPYPPVRRDQAIIEDSKRNGDPHLRSIEEIRTYDAYGTDGERIGRVDDLLLDDTSWAIPYLVVDTHVLLPGGKVLVPTEAVVEIRWIDSRVELSIPVARIVEEDAGYGSTGPADLHDTGHRAGHHT